MPTFVLGKVVGPQGPQGPQGDPGVQGVQGLQGTPGNDGVTPNIQVGSVTTLPAGSQATVERAADSPDAAPVFNFGIPRGADAPDPGDMHSSVYDPQNKSQDVFAYADQKTDEAKQLSAATAAALGLTGDPTVDDALNKLTSLIKDNPYLWDGPKKLGSLPAGALVKLNENGQAKKFIVLDKNHYGPNTGVTLIRKDTFSMIAWNASDGSKYYNGYFGCTMDNFCDGIWPLKLDRGIQECIVPVPIVVMEGRGVLTLHTIYRKGFALSRTEVGISGQSVVVEGTAFDYFDSDDKRKAFIDESETAPVYWGLRSSSISADYPTAGGILREGKSGGEYPSYAMFAPRPAFNLKSDMVISSGVDSDGCYTFVRKGGT